MLTVRQAWRYNTAKLVERFGADETVQPFQDWITKDAHGVMILLCR
jgi:hypothetical protein